MLSLVLLVFAFVLTAVASAGIDFRGWQLGWAGVALYFLSLILTTAGLR